MSECPMSTAFLLLARSTFYGRMLVVIRTVVRGINKRGKRRGMYVPSYRGCTTQILTWGPIVDRVFGGSVSLFGQTDRVGPDRCTRSRSTTLLVPRGDAM